MLAALTACMCANIITIDEGMSGFSNEGVLTVVVLFVVAAGIQLTGALGKYIRLMQYLTYNTVSDLSIF